MKTVRLTCYCANCNVSLIPIEKKPGEEDDEEEEDQEDQGTLLTSLADAQTRQREKAAYEQLKAGGTILLFSKLHFPRLILGCTDNNVVPKACAL